MVESTIAAISTALGEGGIAIIRVSGAEAVNISTKILTRKNFDIPGKLYLTNLIDDDGNILDRVLAVHFAKPKSYTGEDIFEIHTHGGIFIARLCLELLMKNGAELARPGEFTRRAFANGRIDLSQAEGVLGIIKAQSLEAIKASARTLSGGLSEKIQEIHVKILNVQANFEINLDLLLKNVNYSAIQKYKKLAQTTPVTRDIAFVVNDDITNDVIVKMIKKCADKNILKEVNVFDIYKGENIIEGKKSMAYRITLQNETKTLTDTEIEAEVNKIKTGLEKNISGLQLR